MPTNWYMFFIAALIPLIIGAIYYNPKVAGRAWMKTNGLKDEDLEGANMLLIFGLTYLFSLMMAFILSRIVMTTMKRSIPVHRKYVTDSTTTAMKK